MSAKQLVALLVITSVSFLCLLIGGGYLYMFKPELFGLSQQTTHDSLAVPLSVWELQLNQLEKDKARLQSETQRLRDSLQRLTGELAAQHRRLGELQAQLDKVNTTLANEQRATMRDSLRLKNLHVLAEMYERANPAEVAQILANADRSYAAAILRLMKRKTAARVLEQLPKDKALAISLAALEQH
jgi:flagellar motility protein MotE (MotC chaperone)